MPDTPLYSFRPVLTSQGKIERLLLLYASHKSGSNLLEAVSPLEKAMPHVEFNIVMAPEQQPVPHGGYGPQMKIWQLKASDHNNEFFSPHIQDHMNVLQDGKGNIKLVRTEKKPNAIYPNIYLKDLLLADKVAKQDNAFTVETTQLYLDGGNLLFGWSRELGYYVLAGYHILKHNRKIFELDCEDAESILIEEIKKVLGVDTVIWLITPRDIKNKNQQIFHLDLCIVPAGYSDTGKPRLIVGQTPHPDVIYHQAFIYRDPLDVKNNSEMLLEFHQSFKEIAEDLERSGHFDVIRVDIPVVIDNGIVMWLLYLNCLMEVCDSGATAYVASYSDFGKVNSQVWPLNYVPVEAKEGDKKEARGLVSQHTSMYFEPGIRGISDLVRPADQGVPAGRIDPYKELREKIVVFEEHFKQQLGKCGIQVEYIETNLAASLTNISGLHCQCKVLSRK